MNKPQMKALLLRDKEFLKSLYEADAVNAKRILMISSDSKLITLIRFLHMVSNGQIRIKKEHFDSLANKHLKIFRKDFEPKAAAKRLLSGERAIKIQILGKFVNLFHELLFTLFNELIQK